MYEQSTRLRSNETAELADQLGVVLSRLVLGGFELPIYFAAIAPNGTIVAGEYQLAEPGAQAACAFVSERLRPEGLAVPVTITFVDSNGRAATTALGQGESVQGGDA